MKRILHLILIFSVLLALSACGADGGNSTGTPSEPAPPAVSASDPSSGSPAASPAGSYKEEAVTVDSSSGDYQISAVLTTPETDETVPLVVMLHGFGGYKDEGNGFVYIARTLAKRGIASIRMDFARTGEDSRDFTAYTLDGSAADAEDCVDYAIQHANIDASKLGIFGYSNGGRITTLITGAANQRYQARVLLAPAVFSDTEGDQANLAECQETGYREVEWFGNTLKVSREYYESVLNFAENLRSYQQTDIPTLIIRGTEDVMIPEEIVDSFATETGSCKLTIPGADHGYGFYSNDEAGYAVMDTVAGCAASFFAQYLTDDTAEAMFANS